MSTDLQRWDVVPFAWRDRHDDEVMERDDNGPWVRYGDVARLLIETWNDAVRKASEAAMPADGGLDLLPNDYVNGMLDASEAVDRLLKPVPALPAGEG